MAKQYKIKRYNSVYRNRKSPLMKLLIALMWLLGIGALVALGFYGYQSVMDFIENGGASQSSESSSVSSSAPVSSAVSSSSVPVKQEPVYNGITKAVLLPTEISGDQLEAFLDDAAENGANTVVVTYKDADGIVYHDTSAALALEGYAVAEEASDLSEVAKAIKDAVSIPVSTTSRHPPRVSCETSEMMSVGDFERICPRAFGMMQ